MAYAAVISLKQTIHRLLNSSHTPIASSSREILEFAYKQMTSLQEFLKEFYHTNSNRWNALDVKIRDAVHKAEDALESSVSHQYSLSLPDDGALDLEEAARREVHSLLETITKMKDDYIAELQNPKHDDEDEDDGAAVSSNNDFGAEMVGLSEELAEIKEHLLKTLRPYDFGVFSYVGKIGSLRSIAAKALFDETFVAKEEPFDCGAWVTIGRNPQFTEILASILAQVDDRARNDDDDLGKLKEDLYASLKDRRYMIVVDDVDEVEVWDELRKSLPEQHNGSLIVLTTQLIEVAQFAKSFYIHEMPTFFNENVWDYLRLMMFGCEKEIDPEMEKAGKKIAENCGGSLIAVARVIPFLYKTGKTAEWWTQLAADPQHSIFVVQDEISEVCKIKEDEADYEISATAALDLSYALKLNKEYLFPQTYFPKSAIMLFSGMPGIGKTAFIKNIFQDSSISHHYHHRVWIALGPKYKPEEILIDILAQIYPDIDRQQVKEDAKLAADLCAELSEKKCFIVLDDMWKPDPIHHLKILFPNIRAKIFVTTRQLVVGLSLGPDDRFYRVRLLNKEESWDLLHHKVFVDGSCPPQLEKVGKKIANNCEGLPLLILTIANLLLKAEKTTEYWSMVAEEKNTVFKDAYDQMHKVLYPSYQYLPQQLKACFLYMGVFARNHEIPVSKLIDMWVTEGFLEPDPSQTLEDFALKCLKEIVNRSLVMVQLRDSDPKSSKTCRLHSVFWHMCSSEAEKSMFFNAYTGDSVGGLKEQRRVCIRNNILLGIKHEHCNSMPSSVSCTRSLLCTGPHHQYPVPIPFRSRPLLRIVDALSIRLYEFPSEVVELIHLRYLTLTCDGRLPASISKLRNLESLNVRRHLSTKSFEDSSIMPMEIWSMKELRYLRVTGCKLPNPGSDDEVLPNLSTLLDVSIDSCSEEVLRGVPNLKRLGVQIQLEPGEDGKSFHYLNHISSLSKLESLKCVVVNPDLCHGAITPPAPHSMFPQGLKKLSLSGLGYPWSYMDIIGRLPNLEVLKLRCYAFQGPVWETDYVSFCELKLLSIEDTDLVRWRTRNPSFFSVKHLRIKHCYMLEELPLYLPCCVQMLQVADCSPSVVKWAEKMKQNDWDYRIEKLTTDVHSSWDDGNLLA
ncbi:putative late blight resistance protein homolog R1B-16 [Salvia miltiorrhiza]|uniref:putative late blight resistance protein homolog R1B-16 n=1 Tax=Salvia miltiorrhiza TaxID=226208 RepID=UPI0025AD7E3A|nr:putative late blight resistance protein homolog R1B-16 [Salvia miltiorrhiza]XP_057767418.1 putative late blight resistance protein homolog R1B-16 [Salvia miltiorrhiza]